MYVRNTTDGDIRPITYEGYEFTIPQGVVAIYDPAGKHFINNLYRVETKSPGEGAPLPPLVLANEEDWDGKTYAIVTRFKIDYTRFRNVKQLIQLARDRGVSKEKVENWQDNLEDEPADAEEVARAINALPIPEEIRFPETQTESSSNQEKLEQAQQEQEENESNS